MSGKYKVSFRKKALSNIDNITDWFKSKKIGLEVKFLKDLFQAIDFIENNPEKCQIRYKEVRIKFLKKFDFGIHYIIEHKTIYILAVFHTSQSPEHWQ